MEGQGMKKVGDGEGERVKTQATRNIALIKAATLHLKIGFFPSLQNECLLERGQDTQSYRYNDVYVYYTNNMRHRRGRFGIDPHNEHILSFQSQHARVQA